MDRYHSRERMNVNDVINVVIIYSNIEKHIFKDCI